MPRRLVPTEDGHRVAAEEAHREVHVPVPVEVGPRQRQRVVSDVQGQRGRGREEARAVSEEHGQAVGPADGVVRDREVEATVAVEIGREDRCRPLPDGEDLVGIGEGRVGEGDARRHADVPQQRHGAGPGGEAVGHQQVEVAVPVHVGRHQVVRQGAGIELLSAAVRAAAEAAPHRHGVAGGLRGRQVEDAVAVEVGGHDGGRSAGRGGDESGAKGNEHAEAVAVGEHGHRVARRVRHRQVEVAVPVEVGGHGAERLGADPDAWCLLEGGGRVRSTTIAFEQPPAGNGHVEETVSVRVHGDDGPGARADGVVGPRGWDQEPAPARAVVEEDVDGVEFRRSRRRCPAGRCPHLHQGHPGGEGVDGVPGIDRGRREGPVAIAHQDRDAVGRVVRGHEVGRAVRVEVAGGDAHGIRSHQRRAGVGGERAVAVAEQHPDLAASRAGDREVEPCCPR